jgi:hypothetical protein
MQELTRENRGKTDVDGRYERTVPSDLLRGIGDGMQTRWTRRSTGSPRGASVVRDAVQINAGSGVVPGDGTAAHAHEQSPYAPSIIKARALKLLGYQACDLQR